MGAGSPRKTSNIHQGEMTSQILEHVSRICELDHLA